MKYTFRLSRLLSVITGLISIFWCPIIVWHGIGAIILNAHELLSTLILFSGIIVFAIIPLLPLVVFNWLAFGKFTLWIVKIPEHSEVAAFSQTKTSSSVSGGQNNEH